MVSRKNIRDQVRKNLLTKMREGSLQEGQTINLADLARKLNVSVTPIREALTQLQQSRIVTAIPNRGFIITKLSLNEAKDLYDLVAELEVMAIENSTFNDSAIKSLKNQYESFKNSENMVSKINAKFKFHRLLTQHYKNTLAQQIMEGLKIRISFYERKFITDDKLYLKSDNQYNAIISAIEEDNIPSACLVVKMNWMLTLDFMKKQL